MLLVLRSLIPRANPLQVRLGWGIKAGAIVMEAVMSLRMNPLQGSLTFGMRVWVTAFCVVKALSTFPGL